MKFMKQMLAVAATTAILGASGGANAALFTYSNDFSGSGPFPEWSVPDGIYYPVAGVFGQISNSGPASAKLSLTSVGAGSGSLSFDLIGFNTLDGFNCCADTLDLRINGLSVFQGTFPLGGGGGESFSGPSGVTVTGSGSVRTITLPFAAVVGLNTFQFSYPSLQGVGDEGFGLDNVSLRAEVQGLNPPGVPEPATWAMMILGFGAAGSSLRTRRRKTVQV